MIILTNTTINVTGMDFFPHFTNKELHSREIHPIMRLYPGYMRLSHDFERSKLICIFIASG